MAERKGRAARDASDKSVVKRMRFNLIAGNIGIGTALMLQYCSQGTRFSVTAVTFHQFSIPISRVCNQRLTNSLISEIARNGSRASNVTRPSGRHTRRAPSVSGWLVIFSLETDEWADFPTRQQRHGCALACFSNALCGINWSVEGRFRAGASAKRR